jgi:S-adenosylmethionine hydrolase
LSGRIATFTTDFGVVDTYVAEMKGALLSALRKFGGEQDVTLLDVTHLLPRHAVRSASEMLIALRDAFPPDTVHLVVVDPGVGTERRPLAVKSRGQWWVGPDNGVFSRILDDADCVIQIDSVLRRESGGSSRVFDGRDLFAPAAARLLAGCDPATIGSPVVDPVRLAPPRLERLEGGIVGEIIAVDHFGNLRTSVPAGEVPEAARISAGEARHITLRRAYGDAAEKELLAVTGSDGRLEIAVREGSAAERLGLEVGDEVRVAW